MGIANIVDIMDIADIANRVNWSNVEYLLNSIALSKLRASDEVGS
jgi:hypothetical protein